MSTVGAVSEAYTFPLEVGREFSRIGDHRAGITCTRISDRAQNPMINENTAVPTRPSKQLDGNDLIPKLW